MDVDRHGTDDPTRPSVNQSEAEAAVQIAVTLGESVPHRGDPQHFVSRGIPPSRLPEPCINRPTPCINRPTPCIFGPFGARLCSLAVGLIRSRL